MKFNFSKVNENLILFNGQVKYFQECKDYWVGFARTNQCNVLFISQCHSKYKNGREEIIDTEEVTSCFDDCQFVRITPEIDKLLEHQLAIIMDSIKEHNRRFNTSHNL